MRVFINFWKIFSFFVLPRPPLTSGRPPSGVGGQNRKSGFVMQQFKCGLTVCVEFRKNPITERYPKNVTKKRDGHTETKKKKTRISENVPSANRPPSLLECHSTLHIFFRAWLFALYTQNATQNVCAELNLYLISKIYAPVDIFCVSKTETLPSAKASSFCLFRPTKACLDDLHLSGPILPCRCLWTSLRLCRPFNLIGDACIVLYYLGLSGPTAWYLGLLQPILCHLRQTRPVRPHLGLP